MKKLMFVTFSSIVLLSAATVLPAKAQETKAPAVKQTKEKPNSNFTGKVSVKMHTDAKNGLNCSLGSVTFEPGARSNWHSHPGGQILLVTEGTAWYQEKGKAKRAIQTGEAVTCLPNIEHWHGASPEGKMTHMAVGPNSDHGSVTWLGKVSDEVYLGKN
jgi:4-carboxymuconolactone decarboxylase